MEKEKIKVEREDNKATEKEITSSTKCLRTESYLLWNRRRQGLETQRCAIPQMWEGWAELRKAASALIWEAASQGWASALPGEKKCSLTEKETNKTKHHKTLSVPRERADLVHLVVSGGRKKSQSEPWLWNPGQLWWIRDNCTVCWVWGRERAQQRQPCRQEASAGFQAATPNLKLPG